MNVLQRYLKDIVEPAFLEFQQNPNSARYACQACVAVYHAIDRATYPRAPGNLRNDWRKREEFRIVDMIALKYKHIVSKDENEPIEAGKLTLRGLVFGKEVLGTYGFNATNLGEGGIDLHNLNFIIGDAIKFLHQEAQKLPDAPPDED